MKIEYTMGRAGNDEVINAGDIKDKPQSEAIRLIKAGKAKPVKSKKVETQMKKPAENQSKNIYPKEKSNGWYECSDGKSVRGKEKAMEYENNL